MTKVKEFAGRHKKGIIFLAVLAVAIVVVIIVLNGARPQLGTDTPMTTTLAQMDLQQTVAANGTVESASSRKVTSSLTYKVTEVLAEVGDTVEKGQELVKLDLSDLDKTIADTRKSISTVAAQDKLRLEQAQRKLQEAIDTQAINLGKNDVTVQDAQNLLNTANNAVNVARNGVTTAQIVVDPLKNIFGIAQAEVSRLSSALTAAQDTVNRLTAELATVTDPNEIIRLTGELNTAQAEANRLASELAVAQIALDTAQGNLSSPNAKLAEAQNILASASQSAATAQSTYNRAVETRDTVYRSDAISVNMARDNVNTAKLTDSAQATRAQLETYLKQRDEAVITAPITGIVTAANATVGSAPGGMSATAATGTADSLFTIQDTGNLEITSSVPEYDITQLQLGMQVAITTDALDGQAWTGTVTETSPTAADTSGNFSVTVAVSSPVGELAIGMSAKLNIVVDSRENVYAVPYDALTTNAAKETVVVVWEGDPAKPAATPEELAAQRREVVVETGMETDYYVEIISAELADGMEILNDPEGRNVSNGTAGGMFMMGG